jgi:ABC-type dipeptide/oligopeptide/nickel transport system ATPase component
VLRVEGLAVHFRVSGMELRAVDGVSFVLRQGETLGLVGERGSGKTITALAVMGLLESPPAEVSGGRVIFQGRDLLRLPEDALS